MSCDDKIHMNFMWMKDFNKITQMINSMQQSISIMATSR